MRSRSRPTMWRCYFGFLYFIITISIDEAADVEKIRLIGDSNDFINSNSKINYILQCKFRAGYDDPVSSVSWYKDNILVYTWIKDSDVSTSYEQLLGKVETTGGNLQHLHFKIPPSLTLDGIYFCEVAGNENVRSEPYNLKIVDVPSDDFSTNVILLSDPSNEVKNDTLFPEEKNCTLVWEFHTPAIYPRPNVTCGYYSYLHDDIVESVPAGLTMQKLVNQSFQASFDRTHIQIAEIPIDNRLGCSVRVPDTSFKKIVKFEDNFEIDHLIDSVGCPSLALDETKGLQVDLDGGSINCRGDLVPLSDSQAMRVTYSCLPGEIAVFANGSAFHSWSKSLYCNPRDMTWQAEESPSRRSTSSENITDVPACVTGVSSSTVAVPMLSFTLVTIVVGFFSYF